MSYQLVLQQLAALTSIVNAISTNSKKIDELPIQSVVDFNSKIHLSIDGVSKSLTLQDLADSLVNEINNNVGIEMMFGELSGSGNISTSQIVTALNALNYSIVVSPIRTPVIFSFTRLQKKYMFIFLKGRGTWGSANGANPEHPIYVTDLIALPVINLTAEDIQTQNGANIIPLGELPTGDYLTAANSAPRDFSNAGTIDGNGYVITYFFSYTQDGILYFVQFVGDAELYNGSNPLVESDLVATTNNTVTPELDLQGTMNNGSEAIVNTPITFVYDNGSVNVKIALNEDGVFITTNDNTIQVKPDTVSVSSTVSGSDAVEDNEFVTKQQLDTSVSTLNTVISTSISAQVAVLEVSVTTDIVTSESWQGRTLIFNNSTSPRNITINHALNTSGIKTNTGNITFVAGEGRTLVTVTGTATINGGIGSSFSILSSGTTDYLRINNV